MNKVLIITDETVVNKVYQLRGKKVMMDRDLAEMYGVETRILNQALKRNQKRFPERAENHPAPSTLIIPEPGKIKKTKPCFF